MQADPVPAEIAAGVAAARSAGLLPRRPGDSDLPDTPRSPDSDEPPARVLNGGSRARGEESKAGHGDSSDGEKPLLDDFQRQLLSTQAQHGVRLTRLEAGVQQLTDGVARLNKLLTAANLAKGGALYVLVELLKWLGNNPHLPGH